MAYALTHGDTAFHGADVWRLYASRDARFLSAPAAEAGEEETEAQATEARHDPVTRWGKAILPMMFYQ
jgi:hypothetical protein